MQEEFDRILAGMRDDHLKGRPVTRAGKISARIKIRSQARNAVLILRLVGVWRLLSFSFRKNLPDFFILGAAKSGTSTLFNMVISHPGVCDVPAVKTKEPWYFGVSSVSLRWYRCLFPISKNGKLACDASTSLLPSSLAPAQIRCVLPNAKFVVILRNPVDRALSHYEFDKRRGLDVPTSFEAALEAECAQAEGTSIDVPDFFEYMKWGHYAAQLQRWFSLFDRSQFLILTTAELMEDRQETANKIFQFLNLSKHDITNVKNLHTGKYPGMRLETRRMLAEHYKPHNEQLYKLLERRFDWN